MSRLPTNNARRAICESCGGIRRRKDGDNVALENTACLPLSHRRVGSVTGFKKENASSVLLETITLSYISCKASANAA